MKTAEKRESKFFIENEAPRKRVRVLLTPKGVSAFSSAGGGLFYF